MLCRVCKSNGNFKGLLFCCSNTNCNSVYWDKYKVKALISEHKDNPEIINEILKSAGVPKWKSGEHYCYLLRLRSKENFVYVGMTGLHPYERYLNHIRGYKSSSTAKKYATALISFEGPMKKDTAIKRELEWGKELEKKGFKVKGPVY